MKKQRASLDKLFSPRTVAVIGASHDQTFANEHMRALIKAGFVTIYPINQKYKEILGQKCYPSLEDVPGTVDYVVVCIPADKIPSLFEECAAKGVNTIHLYTAGFSETGRKEGEALETALLHKAKATGIRIIGPNCVGIFSPGCKFSNVTGVPLEPGPIAFISQNGGYAMQIIRDGAL